LYSIHIDRKPNKDFLELISLVRGNYSLKVLPFLPARPWGKSGRSEEMPSPPIGSGATRSKKVRAAACLAQHGPNIAVLKKT
jgi:hypothetical protein